MSTDPYNSLLDEMERKVTPRPLAPKVAAPKAPSRPYGAYEAQTEGDWNISRAPQVKDWYKQTYGRDLPVTAEGMSATHRRMGLDHSDSLDVGINPTTTEGQAFLSYLKQNKIPYLAYDRPVPGAATNAHVHVGFPSHGGVPAPSTDPYDALLNELESGRPSVPPVPQPKVTSRILTPEEEEAALNPPLAEPSRKPYDPSAKLSLPARGAREAVNLPEDLSGGPKPYDPGALEPVEANVPKGASQSEVVDALMEKLGPGWRELGQRYREETGREPMRADLLSEPVGAGAGAGTHLLYTAIPTRDFIDTMKAYREGGIEAASRVATERAGRANETARARLEYERNKPYLNSSVLAPLSPLALLPDSRVGDDVAAGLGKTVQGTSQLFENLRKIHEGEAFGDENQRQIDEARARVPAYKTGLGEVLGTGLEVVGDVARMHALPGVGPAMEQFLEHYNRGGLEAAKAAGTITALQAVGVGGDKISKLLELTPAQRQVFVRALQGDVNAAQAAAQGEKGKELLKSFGVGAAFPVGKGERAEVAPRIAPTPDISVGTLEGPQVVRREVEATPMSETQPQPAQAEVRRKPQPVLAHIAGPSGAGKTELMNAVGEKVKNFKLIDLDEFDERAEAALGWSDVPKSRYTDKMLSELHAEKQKLLDEYIRQSDKPIVFFGHHIEAENELAFPAERRILLDVSPQTAAINANRRPGKTLKDLKKDVQIGREDVEYLTGRGYEVASPRKVYRELTELSAAAPESVHHSQLQPRDEAGHFDGPPQIPEGVNAGITVSGEQRLADVPRPEAGRVPDAPRTGQVEAPATPLGRAEEGGPNLPPMATPADIPPPPRVATPAEPVAAPAPRVALPERTAERSFPQTAEAAGLSKATNTTYEVQADAPAIERANKRIEKEGADKVALAVRSSEAPSKDDIVAGQLLARKYSQEGNHEAEVAVINDLAEKLTKAGQQVQAASLIARLSPEGVLIQGQRLLNKRGANRTLTAEEASTLKETAARAREYEAKVSDLQRQIEEMKLRPRSVGGRPRTKLETFEERLSRLESEARARLDARKAQAQEVIAGKGQAGATSVIPDLADYAVIGAVKLAKKGVTVASWSAEMVKEFGEEIKPHLKAIYRQSYSQLKDERAATRREAQERAVRRENPGVTDAAEIQRLMTARLDAQTEARRARQELERTFKQLGRSPARRALATVGDTIGAARTMLTGGDVSFGLRQGKMAVRHPAMFVKEWAKAWRSLSESQAERVRSEMELHPDFKVMQKDMGMQFTSLGSKDPAMHEEGFQSRLVGRLPVFRNVERVNAAMLDGLRFGWAKSYLDNVRKLGLDPQAEAKALKEGGELIMDGTGRADLGRSLNQMTPVLSNTLFSPRFWASRVKWLTVHPTRILLPESMGGFSRPARVEAIKTLMAFSGVVATQLAVARATGAQVDTDPDSRNFLKGRWGPLRVDFAAGFQGHIRLALRLAKTVAGQTKTAEGKPRQSGADMIGTYVRGKEAPLASLIHDVFLSEKKDGQGTNIVGEPVYPFGDPKKRGYDRVKSSAIFQRIAPMLYRDAQEAYEQMGWKGGAAAGLGSFVGEGVSTYADRPKAPAVSIPDPAEQLKREMKRDSAPKVRF
jgi:hypothetical protein